jgi:hypothetical protein
MDSDRIRTVIEAALSVSVQGIQLPGIAGAEIKTVAISSKQLERIAGLKWSCSCGSPTPTC